MAKKTGTVKKRVVKVGTEGKVFVHSTFNNVIITIANADGQVISWSSAGKMGFRGSKKNTPYAAQTAATDCAKVAYDLGLRKVKVYVKGPGAGRESAIRTVHGAGIEVIIMHWKKNLDRRCIKQLQSFSLSWRDSCFEDIKNFIWKTDVCCTGSIRKKVRLHWQMEKNIQCLIQNFQRLTGSIRMNLLRENWM